jgi:hypothetical protein
MKEKSFLLLILIIEKIEVCLAPNLYISAATDEEF